MQPHSVMQNFILSASITSLQGIYDVTTLQVHIMCQHTQVPHLKCILCQTNKLLCCHFKPNPVPATNNITHADITLISHLHLLSVYYQNLNRDNRYLSHALSTLISPQCSFVLYIYTFAHHLHHIDADSISPATCCAYGLTCISVCTIFASVHSYILMHATLTTHVARCRDGDNGFKVT